MLPAYDPDRLSFVPDTSVIHYMRKQNFTWAVILKELIDHSIDASASCIQLALRRSEIRITDDGRGCPDLLRMIRLGGRADHDETQIGQYGVGLKDTAIWGANRLGIPSICAGMQRTVQVNWDVIMRHGLWRLETPITDLPTQAPSGTTITLSDLRHPRPPLQRLVDEFGRTYLPWLRAGGTILLTSERHPPEKVEAFELPTLLEQQTEVIPLEDKSATVTLGMVPPTMTLKDRGLLFLYGPRVIMEARRLGLTPDAVAELFGWIAFSRGWTLEKNKQGFLDDLTPLGDAIASRFATLIAHASHHHVSKPLADIRKAVNDRFKQLKLAHGPRRKAVRNGPHEKEGTVEPTGTGSPHKRAKNVQPGDTFPVQPFLSMQYAKKGPDVDLCTIVEDVLLINEDSPLMAEIIDNPELLHNQIVWAIATYLGTDGYQPQMTLPWGETAGTFGRVMRLYTLLAGMPLPKAPRRATVHA